MLDAMLREHFRVRPTVLAMWRTARRVQRVRTSSMLGTGDLDGTEVTPSAAA